MRGWSLREGNRRKSLRDFWIFFCRHKTFRSKTKWHLVHFPGETSSAVDVDAAVVHDGYDVAAVRAHCHCGDAVVMGTDTEDQLVRVNVYEAHQAVLTQHAEDLQRDKQDAGDTGLFFLCV